ncbi:MAG: glycolate oxidase subunit GlcE [Candidatus Latescibacteria bacterium]|nr:glycolate oxidase subunit GlcE [Candidatus Latescibacterota bacterium]
MPGNVLRPADAGQVAELVRDAAANDSSLALRAGRTKDRLGRATSAVHPVDLSALSGVVTYEPEELILIARPATPLAEAEALLAEHGQHLAFEPPYWGTGATLGGTLGVAASGPRRFVAGAARDFVLGMEFVDGQGRVIHAGGRVVKNVTGYDLWRSLVGAYGTLGIMTEVCLKLWPQPASQRTLAVAGLQRQAALALMLDWSRRPESITGIACTSEDDTVWIRIEGPEAATLAQTETLWREAGAGDILSQTASRNRWESLREGGDLTAAAGEVCFRIVVPPSRADDALTQLTERGLSRWCLDWAGGLLWAVMPEDCPAHAVHAIADGVAGMASRLGSEPQDANREAFTPLSAGVGRLNESLRRTLDPHALFNPGRAASPRAGRP